jgi:hypothetical protein
MYKTHTHTQPLFIKFPDWFNSLGKCCAIPGKVALKVVFTDSVSELYGQRFRVCVCVCVCIYIHKDIYIYIYIKHTPVLLCVHLNMYAGYFRSKDQYFGRSQYRLFWSVHGPSPNCHRDTGISLYSSKTAHNNETLRTDVFIVQVTELVQFI